MKNNPKVVCLGGGIGTMNLLKGLKKYPLDLTVIVSMADDGGSAGRLRRLYNVPPPGDIVSCLATLSKNDVYSKFLTYRFPGNRYGKDHELEGQKMGNLMMIAAQDAAGSFEGGIELLKKIFNVDANIFPATNEPINLHAKTIDGRIIKSEEKIDLGQYNEPRVLNKIYLEPESPEASKNTLVALDTADCIIAGPGDLYTNILPVLVVPEISKKLESLKSKKIFVVNVANKPFETKNYVVSDFIEAIKRHLTKFPFDLVITNTNHTVKIPKQYHYDYVKIDKTVKEKNQQFTVIEKDLVDASFPLYHDSNKLAEIIMENL